MMAPLYLKPLLVFLGQNIGTLRGHEDEVLDVAFDFTGQYLLSASADSTARMFNATTHHLMSTLEGHEGEISKVCVYTLNYIILTDLI